MANKSAHPDIQLFDYLSGAIDGARGRVVEDHLSECADCALVVDVVRALKVKAGTLLKDRAGGAQVSANLKSQTDDESAAPDSIAGTGEPHPDVSELADFFYSRSLRARHRAVAAHVATCRSCVSEIAEYARAERAASQYDSTASKGEVPEAAWQMIRDWEESSFAKTKAPSGPLSAEMLAKLSEAMGEKKEPRRDLARKPRGEPDRKREKRDE
jgi:anti-sigma factor RsiW